MKKNLLFYAIALVGIYGCTTSQHSPTVSSPAVESDALYEPESESDPTEEAKLQKLQSDARVHFERGLNYANVQDYSNALKEFEYSNRIYPTSESYSNAGAIYLQQKDYNLAEEELHRALRIDSSNALASYNLMSLYSMKGDLDLSKEYMRMTLANGFTEYDLLRYDPDLQNVRATNDFYEIAEEYRVFLRTSN